MKTYTVLRKPDVLDWAQIPVAAIDTDLSSPATDVQAWAQVCYDESGLYVHLEAVEAPIRAVEKGPLCSPCEDSCLEFFLSPCMGDTRYFNIEFNPLGSVYFGIGSSRYDLMRLIPEGAHPIVPRIGTTEKGWYVEYKLSFDLIRQFFPGFSCVSGQAFRANFYKCSDCAQPPHYLSWNPITATPADFHRPQDFGTLIFA